MGAPPPQIPEEPILIMRRYEQHARLFTYVISPPTVYAVLGFLLPYLDRPNNPLRWGLFYNLFIVILPLIFIAFLGLTGRVKTVSMTQQERHIPYILAVLSSSAMTYLIWRMNGPVHLLALGWVNILGLAGLAITNWWWKVSNHATAVVSGTVIASAVWGWFLALFLAPVAFLVCYARVYMGKHTLWQVVGGSFLGAFVVFLLMGYGYF